MTNGTPLKVIQASVANGHRVYDGACIWCGSTFEEAAQEACDGSLVKRRLEAAQHDLSSWERERDRVMSRRQEAPSG